MVDLGFAELIFLLRKPFWWTWALLEAALVEAAVIIALAFPAAAPVACPPLFLLVNFIFVVLCFGVAFSARFRHFAVRPEALIETRHVVCLVIGGSVGSLFLLVFSGAFVLSFPR